jgi:hypothetical protein
MSRKVDEKKIAEVGNVLGSPTSPPPHQPEIGDPISNPASPYGPRPK